jgi:SAM-dependent methyltransferase
MHLPSPTTPSTNIVGVPRPCPVCASTAASTIFTNRMVPCAGYDFSAPILQCLACGACYAGTALPAYDLNQYYANFSKYDTLSSSSYISPLDRERAGMAVAFLAPLLESIGSVLDVGCSAGFFLSTLRDAGVKDLVGIDPAMEATQVARSLFDLDVLKAQAETFAEYDKFDLVCLMAVFEHLLEPWGLLNGVARQLKPGARVLIEVPDAGAFDRPGTNGPLEPFGEFSNEHINFFSIGDIRRLAHSVGLEVERWQSVRSINGPPGLFALLQKRRAAPALVDADTGSTLSAVNSSESITRYVAKSLRVMEDVERRLRECCGDEVLIYGAGNHTCRLMAQSPALAGCRVPAIFDRNHHLHGARMANSTILPPAQIAEFPDLPIVVSTFNARAEIHAGLKAASSRPVVLLYD